MTSHFCMAASSNNMTRVGFFVIISLFVVLCFGFFSISICDEILGVSFQHREKVTVKHTLLSTTKLKTNPEQTGNTPLVFSFPLGVLTAVCNQN